MDRGDAGPISCPGLHQGRSGQKRRASALNRRRRRHRWPRPARTFCCVRFARENKRARQARPPLAAGHCTRPTPESPESLRQRVGIGWREVAGDDRERRVVVLLRPSANARRDEVGRGPRARPWPTPAHIEAAAMPGRKGRRPGVKTGLSPNSNDANLSTMNGLIPPDIRGFFRPKIRGPL